MPSKERRAFLHEAWGFKCTCSLCLSSPSERAESDGRRMQIVQVRDAMDASLLASHYHDAITDAEALLELYAAEDLLPLVAEAHETLATAYLALGRLHDAETHATLGLAGRIEYRGADSGQADVARKLLHKIRLRKGGNG
jgi:hypothetical protein